MCGEIYHQKDNGRFQYVCCFCFTTLDRASQFELHVVMHLKTEESNFMESKIKLEETTPDEPSIEFVDLEPSTQENIAITTDLQIEECTSPTVNVKEEPSTDITNCLETSIPCEYCDLRFLCNGLKDIHSAQNHAQVKLHSCELCTATFDSQEKYSKHEILHMNFEDPLTCPYCNQLQLDKTRLGIHLNEQLPFDANESRITISKVTTLPRTNSPFKCPTCKKTFKYNRSARSCEFSHIKNDKEELSGTLECDFCGKTFGTLTDFESHIELHRRRRSRSDTEPIECEICQRVYKGKSNFLVHIRTHFYNKTYKCRYCDKTYPYQSTRSQHEHIHLNEQHLCTLCGENFPLRLKLNRHTREKHGDPNVRYKCTLCPREFAKKGNLGKHMKIHSATRSYECKECSKMFFNAKTLRQHAILHSGTKPHLCKYCGVGFSQSAGRRGHEKRVHETNVVK